MWAALGDSDKLGYNHSRGDPYLKTSGKSGAALMHGLGVCVHWKYLHCLEECWFGNVGSRALLLLFFWNKMM